jgi:hypothetical protein
MGQEMCKVSCDEKEKTDKIQQSPRAQDEAKVEIKTFTAQEVLSSAPGITENPSKSWEVTIYRPEGASLGLELRPQKYLQNYIVVGIILESSEVVKFNAANPDLAIKMGDRIVQVNGIRGDPRGMVDVFFSTKGAASFQIALERYETIE